MVCVGDTALIEASRYGYLPIVKHLVEHKANIEAKNNNGMYFWIPLPQFCLVCVCILFACGLWMLMCGVDVMLIPGYTALIYASRWGRLPVVKHLVEHKANIEAKTIDRMCFRFRFHCSV